MSTTIEKETALLFDLDGTLLDTAPDLAAAINHARKELLALPPLSTDALRPFVAKGTQAMVLIGTNQTSDPIIANDFRHAMLDYYSRHPAIETRPFDGIAELLDYLDAENRPWGVVTNKLSHFAVPVLDGNGRFQAALAFHGPQQRVTIDSAVAQVDVLRDGAKALARLLEDEQN